MIETGRLLLRQWREADREPWAAMNADPEVMRHFPKTLDRAEADAVIERQRAQIEATGAGFFAVERRADGAFLGFIGLNRIASEIPLKGRWETGWRLARHAWGQGYATEGAQAALAHGFGAMELPRIVAYTTTTNRSSMAVMERIGMAPVPAEDFDHPLLADGHPLRRHVVYAIDR